MRTSVFSVAAAVSSGSRWRKSLRGGANCQIGSSSVPSRRGAFSARTATAARMLELAASVCACASSLSAAIRIASDARVQWTILLEVILPDRRNGLIPVTTESVDHLFRRCLHSRLRSLAHRFLARQFDLISHCAASVLQQFLFVFVLVELLEEAVDIFFLQIVGRGETELARVTAADADFVHLPHPGLEIQTNDRRDVHRHNRAAKGRVWGSPGFGAALDHFREHEVSQPAMAAFDPVKSDIVGEFDRGAQPPQRRDVRAADSLKAFGAKLGLVPAFGGDGAPQAVDDFVAYVEKAGALGSHQPLMRTCGIHVAANVVDVEAHHARNMGAIDGREYPFRSGKSGEF